MAGSGVHGITLPWLSSTTSCVSSIAPPEDGGRPTQTRTDAQASVNPSAADRRLTMLITGAENGGKATSVGQLRQTFWKIAYIRYFHSSACLPIDNPCHRVVWFACKLSGGVPLSSVRESGITPTRVEAD